MNSQLPGYKYSVSGGAPKYAPADFETVGWKVLVDDWDEDRAYGVKPSNLKCESCGAGGEDKEESDKTEMVFFYSNTQRNGNYSTRTEIRCRACGAFSTIETWEEG
eukprot:GFYU01021521.1.p1 GENE.GFYU01021521.1~~GFYU01021521.1.p1  ORF type:complete len:106 (+),score=19.58 GFYU01021521.1:145-462(+)